MCLPCIRDLALWLTVILKPPAPSWALPSSCKHAFNTFSTVHGYLSLSSKDFTSFSLSISLLTCSRGEHMLLSCSWSPVSPFPFLTLRCSCVCCLSPAFVPAPQPCPPRGRSARSLQLSQAGLALYVLLFPPQWDDLHV